MNTINTTNNGYYHPDQCDLGEFISLTSMSLTRDEVKQAADIQNNVPVYDISALREKLNGGESRYRLMAEWAHVLQQSAGVLVLKNAYADTGAIDEATTIYQQIIAREKQANGEGADHFATAGSNDRVWNSLQKLCEAAPQTYISYFSNPVIDAVCEAWLGPNYQMTAQVNLVHPGGSAQLAHRDYHLGFQTAEISSTYPAHVHDLSPLMTLQGAIAHCDMPVESGPTKLLPFSQLYRPGYAAWRRDDFRACFEDHCIQLPLKKGDALFFNPALFHGAGANVSADIHRLANLLQVSSAFGRMMESINRVKMSEICYPYLHKMWSQKGLSEVELDAVIASTAEGYSFPTNLDLDPPVGGLAPQTQQALVKEAVVSGWSEEKFRQKLKEQQNRQRA